MTTTADSATITAQGRSQGRRESVHAMNEPASPQEGRSPPARSPDDLRASARTAQD
ncbi:hypothetical protein ACFQVA_32605 [Actinomadura keratinilytica]